ncbi:kinase-like domain-containing protein [Zychaea mexicana]|uniref:kinase-like domain-containing protein n=1 Tax=Zychaea mexicana TaxID=64656 RepID=UPI0022FE4175|nr:kinase-like domain-containing protein [Zychaea mexicana]KAI9497049.1 kinase-like domain-containing protein [Zychaea mexicana]
MDDNELEKLYTRQVQEELLQQTRQAVTRLIELYPHEFGLENLILADSRYLSTVPEKLAQLYQEHWALIWRQQLSYKMLAEKYGRDNVIASTHPRAQKAASQIYVDELDQYMQWFPWSWFSNMQFIGAGGFSAVYAAVITQPYDLQPMKIALKIVDDKILNEIAVQSKAFLPLLFQGLTVCESTGDLMMVMKVSNDGNLEDHMKLLPLGDLDLKTITGTILRLAANLADLHKVGMCHRNVHPRNIVCTDSDYFLVDYRFSTPSKESSSVTALTKAVYGRLPYIAPEVRQGIYTEKSDIYSLGVIIWQLVSKVIFPSPDVLLDGSSNNTPTAAGGNSNEDNVYRVDTVPGLPEWYQKLYVACLEPRPENRPDANEICQALQPIHENLEYSVPLDPRVTEYIVARRAEVADHLRTFSKVKGIVSASTTRLYTLTNLPTTLHFFSLPFTNVRFQVSWPPVVTASVTPASSGSATNSNNNHAGPAATVATTTTAASTITTASSSSPHSSTSPNHHHHINHGALTSSPSPSPPASPSLSDFITDISTPNASQPPCL